MNPGKRVSPYIYQSKLFLYLPVLLFFIATLVGCAPSMTVKDSLPTDSPKGYVEFYQVVPDPLGYVQANIYSRLDNYKRVLEGKTGVNPRAFIPDGKVLRVAKLPGTYNFVICLGEAEKVVAVAVEEGKITPVKIEARNVHTVSYNYPITKVSFNLAVTVEEARSIAAYELTSGTTPTTESEPGPVSTSAAPGGPKESDIVRGLTLVSDRQYTKAVSSLDSGLKWLKSNPSYRATTDSLVRKEAEYIGKLIEQIRAADQKGVFGSSDPMAKVIEKAIEAQAKVIKSIDDKRRSRSGAALAPTATGTTSRTMTETRSGQDRKDKPETGTESLRRALAAARRGESIPAAGSGSVRGVLKNKETGTPLNNVTIALLKVKSIEGGKATIEFGISPDGKMVGGMSTKTDSSGAFRFEEVPKGTPYVLGAVDQNGKNIVIVLKEDDNVKDVGVVYQKKQPEKEAIEKIRTRRAGKRSATRL